MEIEQDAVPAAELMYGQRALRVEEAIRYMREHGIAISWDQAAGALQASTTPTPKTVTGKAS